MLYSEGKLLLFFPSKHWEVLGSMSQNKVKLHEVGESEVGQRVDNFFFKTLKGIPKSRIYRAIRKGEIRVNSKKVEKFIPDFFYVCCWPIYFYNL